MKKLLLACLFMFACGPVPPRAVLVADVALGDYQYIGSNIYYYYNDCGPIYYYSDGTYNAICTYPPPDEIMTAELVRIGNNLLCPGPSYRKIEYVNDGFDMMDYTVDCK